MILLILKIVFSAILAFSLFLFSFAKVRKNQDGSDYAVNRLAITYGQILIFSILGIIIFFAITLKIIF